MLSIETWSKRDHKVVLSLLKQKDAEYYMCRLKSERELKVVLRKVSHDFGEDDILKELTENHGCEPNKVIRLFKNKTTPMPLVLIVLPNNPENAKLVRKPCLDNFCHICGITVEKYRGSKLPVQCFSCRFFHFSIKCTMSPGCVKCGTNHHYSTC